MTVKRLQWLLAFLTALGGGVLLYAQNPVSISQVGTTPVTTTVPVSGTVTANAGTGTLTVGQATGTNLHVVVDTAPTTAVTGTFWQATQPVSGTFWQATQPVSGTFWQATQPVSGTVTANAGSGTFNIQANASVNQTQWNGTTVDTNSGTKSAGTVRVVLATDQPALTNKLLVTPDSVALPANQSVNVNQVNGAAVASPDANSYVIFTSAATATTAAGTSTCYAASAASTNSTNCKASAGNLYAIHVTNTTTTNYFLRLYNSSSAPTCSSATGFVETIPALGAAANGGVNGRINMPPQAFSTGIGFCFTGGSSSTDNTNAATGVTITLLYK